MKPISERFKTLGIAGNGIGSLRLVPGSKLSLSISVLSSDRKAVKECELQFLRILHSTVNTQGVPFFEIIVENYILENSDYLRDILKEHKPQFIQTGDFHHFVIEITKGFIHVIAEDFSFSVMKESKLSGHCGDIAEFRPKPWKI